MQPPDWFDLASTQSMMKPHTISTRVLVENEKGLMFAKTGFSDKTVSALQTKLPMGASPYMPVYFLFVKAINLKRYSVYACYNDKLRFPLFYTDDISMLGKLHRSNK